MSLELKNVEAAIENAAAHNDAAAAAVVHVADVVEDAVEEAVERVYRATAEVVEELKEVLEHAAEDVIGRAHLTYEKLKAVVEKVEAV